MESSSSKVEAMKPVLLKAGIPLAVSLAGFILAKIATRKSSIPTTSSQIQVNNVDQDLPCDEDDHAYAEEILRLTRRIEDMQGLQVQLEKRFVDYQGLKDREMVLVELHTKMMLEIHRVEFLEREVSLVEAENRRFENVAAKEYFELSRLGECRRSENERLLERVRKLLSKNKEHSRILRKQCLLIRCKETEISRNKNEIKELKLVIERLQGERSVASKGEREEVTVEDCNNELIYLKWSNACLRLELMRRSQEHTGENKETDNGLGEFVWDNELDQRGVEQGESYRSNAHAHSKRCRLIAKLKRWVEGSLDEKEKHGSKCFPGHSVSDGAQYAYVPSRKSCSSV